MTSILKNPINSSLNNQAPEKRRVDILIDVHSIFYTIQGEGPFSGTPAVFVRLAGCNLQCPACDTEYTQGRRAMRVVDVVAAVAVTARGKYQGLVVITGGEPFRQDIGNLINLLVAHGFYVQIETNGTLPAPEIPFNRFPHEHAGAYIVVSPKGSHVTTQIETYACAYKYVLTAGEVDTDGLPIRVLDHPCSTRVARPQEGVPVYIQPADVQDALRNRDNLQICIASCLRHGYLLQLQTHKLVGLP